MPWAVEKKCTNANDSGFKQNITIEIIFKHVVLLSRIMKMKIM